MDFPGYLLFCKDFREYVRRRDGSAVYDSNHKYSDYDHISRIHEDAAAFQFEPDDFRAQSGSRCRRYRFCSSALLHWLYRWRFKRCFLHHYFVDRGSCNRVLRA